MDIQNHDSESCFPKVKHWRENVPYQFHQGFWFNPKHLQATKQVLDHFKPLPNDVILASFPKTGTTWLKSLLYSIVNRASTNQLVTSHPHELVPSLEMQVYGGLVANSPPHFPSNTSSSVSIFSTHIPYQILGKTLNSSDCRVVYVTRNPKDTLISLWHFANSVYLGQKWEPQPIEDIVSKFCKGTVIFGPYFDHVLGYQKESLERPKKFFFITYEELKSDPNIHVKRLAEFLGCPFLGEDMEEQVEEVVRSCSIETLKKHEVNNSSIVPSWTFVQYKSLFRKGLVGDHMNYLTKDMIERIDAITKEKFHGINLWGENWMS